MLEKSLHKKAIDYIFDDLLIKRNLQNYEDFFDADLAVHFPKGMELLHQTEFTGCQDIKTMEQKYIDSFHYNEAERSHVVICGDQAFVRWKLHGQHCGDFFDLKVTNKEFIIEGHTLFSFNGRSQIREVWQHWDMLGMLLQLGSDIPKTCTKASIDLSKRVSILTSRERECLKYLLEGLTAKQTGKKLFLSFRTIEFHIEKLKNKLNCNDKQELFHLARQFEQHGLI